MKKLCAIASVATIPVDGKPSVCFGVDHGGTQPAFQSDGDRDSCRFRVRRHGGPDFASVFQSCKQGFISTINDNVAIDFGVDILNWPSPDYGVTGAVVPVMLQWNIFLTRDWSVFGEAGVAFQNWFADGQRDDQTFFVWPGMSVGARYYINPGNFPALVIRVGYPSGLTIGVSF